MNTKIILIVIGCILLLIGGLLLVAAIQHSWEVKEYKKLFNKDTPKNIQDVTYIIGGIITGIGLILTGWGISMNSLKKR